MDFQDIYLPFRLSPWVSTRPWEVFLKMRMNYPPIAILLPLVFMSLTLAYGGECGSSEKVDVKRLLVSTPAPPGWRLAGEVRLYSPDNVHEVIDGQNQIYLSYDLVEMAYAEYEPSEGEGGWLGVLVFDMGRPEHALGVFAQQHRGVEAEYLPGPWQEAIPGSLWVGRYYVEIQQTPEPGTASEAIAKAVAKRLPRGPGPERLVEPLPPEGMLPHSAGFTRRGFLGLDGLGNVKEAEYRLREESIRLFLSSASSPKGAAGLLAELRNAMRDPVRDVDVGDEGFLVRREWVGTVVLARAGRWIVGSADKNMEAKPSHMLKEFAEQLSRKETGRMRTRPLVIGHRGFSAKCPENTLVSYREAIRAGAKMAECDVRLSADKVPVLIHDEELDRTSNGKGPVGNYPLAKLKTLDAGSWKGPQFAGEPIPTLEEALKAVKGKLRLAIETKDGHMEQEVVETVRKSGTAPEDVVIFSFDQGTLKRITEIEPLFPTVWLLGKLPEEPEEWRAIIRTALRTRVCALALQHENADARFIRLAHETGFPIYVWTVNDRARMEEFLELGVDGIVTDRVDVLLEVVGE